MSPETLEGIVRMAFAETLGRAIADQEGFFEAGGDSLAAEQLLTALSERLSVELPGWLLLDYPSIATLSHALPALLPPRSNLA